MASEANNFDIADGTRPVIHPLTSPSLLSILQREDARNMSAEQLYRNLGTFARGHKLPDGSFSSEVGVRWAPDFLDLDLSDADLPPPLPPPPAVQAIGNALQAELQSALPSDLIEVHLSTNTGGAGSLVGVRYQQALEMIRGQVSTHTDLRQVRQQTVDQWKQEGTERLDPLLAAVDALGAQVVDANPYSGTVHLRIAAGEVAALADRTDVVHIQLYRQEEDEDAGYSIPIEGPVDGMEVADYMQTNPFYNRGYQGEGNETLVVTEGSAHLTRNTHVEFNNGLGGARVFNCDGTSPTVCSWTSVTTGVNHPTKVTSILAADLTLGQDPAIRGTTGQLLRSGVARQAKVMTIARSPASRVLSILDTRSDVYILNQSSSSNNDDPACLGNDPRSQDWNALYEAGYALINSAGNDGNADPTDCKMGSPASAIGVLPVAAIRIENAPTPTEDLHSASSRGGTATEGAGRTIMGLATLTGHNYRARPFPTGAQYAPATNRFGITSAAAPALTGGAALFREWFVDTYGNLVDDPGILYVNLLLQGDGVTSITADSYNRTGYNNLYGAGRFRMRAFDGQGLDQPAGWETGSVCIATGQTHTLDLFNGAQLPAGVDYIKSTAWWYDHDHDDPNIGGHDTYTLSIQRQTSSGGWFGVDSDSSADSRKRVFFEGSPLPAGGVRWRIRISGGTVTSDNEGCGNNSNRVTALVGRVDREPVVPGGSLGVDEKRRTGGSIQAYQRRREGGLGPRESNQLGRSGL